jgi:hypothetical protein
VFEAFLSVVRPAASYAPGVIGCFDPELGSWEYQCVDRASAEASRFREHLRTTLPLHESIRILEWWPPKSERAKSRFVGYQLRMTADGWAL